MSETTRTNGGPLSDRQMEALTFTFADHLRVKGELDEAQKQITALTLQLQQAEVENEALHSFNNLLESRINAAMIERDLAVDRRSRYESLIEVIDASIVRFKVPAAPVIRDAATAANPLETGE